MQKETRLPIIGSISFPYGEYEQYTDAAEFLKDIADELPYRGTSGFTFKVMDADAETRKAVDDMVYNEYGEPNPHDLAYYARRKAERRRSIKQSYKRNDPER